jgi:multidrug efflux pump subunit AcrA (membrane-fusion protein)
MTWFSNLIPYGLATAGIILVSAITTKTTGTSPAISQTSPPTTTQTSTTTPQSPEPTTSPRRLTVTVNVAEPSDLKIKEGQQVKVGDLIADRERERSRLSFQQKQLKISLTRLETANITPPAPPTATPTITSLPPISYLEHEAAVEKSKAAIASVSSELDLKKQEINYLSKLPNLDPIIIEHERAKLAELQRKHTAAVRDYQLAIGKLQTAKDSRKYQEYQATVDQARRVEESNQTRLNYQRQLAEYEQRLTDREFQITQIKTKLNEVENAIANLSIIKAPYSGTIRRIKWLGQSPDGSLTAEVSVMVNRERRTGNRERETPIRGFTPRFGGQAVSSDRTNISLSRQ